MVMGPTHGSGCPMLVRARNLTHPLTVHQSVMEVPLPRGRARVEPGRVTVEQDGIRWVFDERGMHTEPGVSPSN